MRVLSYFLAFSLSTASLFAAELTNARAIDLGSGFQEIKGNENGKSVRLLYFGDTKLARLGNYSISPSGLYAAFQDFPAGIIYLFRAEEQSLVKLTGQLTASVKDFNWNERLEIVEVVFDGKEKPRSFALE